MKIKTLGFYILIILFAFGCATGENNSNTSAVVPSFQAATGVNNGNTSSEWAVVKGFRSAQFGMIERDVIKAIKNDFGIEKKQVSRKIHPNEKTVTLGIEAKELVPGSGTAKVFYIMGYKSKRLIHINLIWGKPVTKTLDAEAVVATANQLRNYFAQKKYQKAGFALNAPLSDGDILVFQGKDRKDRAARLLLSNPGSGDDKKVGENIALTLSYIEKPLSPDVFRITKEQGPSVREKESESIGFWQGLSFAADLLNAVADGLNGTSNTYRYESPTSSYNSNISSGYTPSYNNNAPSGYTSSTGRSYQYDLSNPSQRALYGADPGAQLRDRIDPNPLRRIERNTGQYGGGVLNNNNSLQGNWVD